VEDRIARFIDRSNNASLATMVCVVCAQQHDAKDVDRVKIGDMPNKDRLRPKKWVSVLHRHCIELAIVLNET
jgi:hypothetical protein